MLRCWVQAAAKKERDEQDDATRLATKRQEAREAARAERAVATVTRLSARKDVTRAANEAQKMAAESERARQKVRGEVHLFELTL